MTKQTGPVYCKERMVDVDLQKGFHLCIEENQCFSDEPCPLERMFDQRRCEARSEAMSKLAPAE